MPFCEPCQKYHAPSAMNDDGTCPVCGTKVDEIGTAQAIDDESAPWHFKLLIVAVVVYLGWRMIQIFDFLWS